MQIDTHIVLLQERLRIVVAVNRNLRDSIENGRILATSRDASLKPRKDQFEAVTGLDLLNELVDGEVASD